MNHVDVQRRPANYSTDVLSRIRFGRRDLDRGTRLRITFFFDWSNFAANPRPFGRVFLPSDQNMIFLVRLVLWFWK